MRWYKMAKKYRNRLYALGILIIIISSIFIYLNLSKVESPLQTFQLYKANWETKDFKAMYNRLTSETRNGISEQQFVDKYNNIYKGIGVQKVTIQFDKAGKLKNTKEKTIKLPFSLVMDTSIGSIKFNDYVATLTQEKINNKNHWRIVWNESLIFPEMAAGDKIRVETLYSKRGEIYDRKGNGLAINAPIITIGIHPSKFLKNKDQNISEMAKILDIQPAIINKKLKSTINAEQFVPIVNIASTQKQKISEIMKIEGVIYQKPQGRVYPGGEAFGSLIGYIGPITAEQLKEVKGNDYNQNSVIGKAGLESELRRELHP